MFTGIVSDVGEVLGAEDHGQLRRMRIACGYDPATIEIGASVAHAGVCLTVVDIARAGNRTTIAVDVGAETLALTTLGAGRGAARGSIWSARCASATSSAAIWSAAMPTEPRKSPGAAISRAWRISGSRR